MPRMSFDNIIDYYECSTCWVLESTISVHYKDKNNI